MNKLKMQAIRITVSLTTALLFLPAVRAEENPAGCIPQITAQIALKVPGNPAKTFPLHPETLANDYYDRALQAEEKIPVRIGQRMEQRGDALRITTDITAAEEVWFHFGMRLATGFRHKNCLFYLPGFWYHRNERSPREAPSIHGSDSWTVREDRLSTPLCGIYDERQKCGMRVVRIDGFKTDALWAHREGEVLLGGMTSLGYTGFENEGGDAMLSFGYPYQETPYSYIRKLTLAPPVEAFVRLAKGETVSLTWEVSAVQAADYSGFVADTWRYSYDTYAPKPVETPYTPERMKEVLSAYFTQSYVDRYPVKYTSGVELRTDVCESRPLAEIGFVGRVLLNAFNALEYGEQTGRAQLVEESRAVFDSYRTYGMTENGLFREVMHFDPAGNILADDVLSIRRQSEGVYAMLHFLQYEKLRGRHHPEWERLVRRMLDRFVTLQNPDGSFPRKFRDDGTVVDPSGGSTPSATLPLVMGARYFGDRDYLKSALLTGGYLERELISKGDYFSSTLDANCEDKEASLYAAAATYYLALATKGAEREHFTELCRRAAYFAVSWYYTWDVPFAQGQMLGDIGLKTRGWGNVSVENNHIDVFVFELTSVLRWLSSSADEPRFAAFADVIDTSMRQLLPYEGHLCGVAKTGYYPEVVQHTNWDYGHNGKGFYNDIFAPGWTVASLWEILTPGRAERFIGQKR